MEKMMPKKMNPAVTTVDGEDDYEGYDFFGMVTVMLITKD